MLENWLREMYLIPNLEKYAMCCLLFDCTLMGVCYCLCPSNCIHLEMTSSETSSLSPICLFFFLQLKQRCTTQAVSLCSIFEVLRSLHDVAHGSSLTIRLHHRVILAYCERVFSQSKLRINDAAERKRLTYVIDNFTLPKHYDQLRLSDLTRCYTGPSLKTLLLLQFE